MAPIHKPGKRAKVIWVNGATTTHSLGCSTHSFPSALYSLPLHNRHLQDHSQLQVHWRPNQQPTTINYLISTATMNHSRNSSFSTMPSMRTPSELSLYLGADLFADFDGAYNVNEDDRSRIDTEDEHPRTSSADVVIAGSSLHGSLKSNTAKDAEEQNRSWRIWKAIQWLGRMLSCS